MSYKEKDYQLHQEIKEHDAQANEVAEAARNPSFSKVEFLRRIRAGDDWQKLIQAHLYLEFIASRMLEAELPNPGAINLARMSFSAKLDLISALGLIPQEFTPAVRRLSKLRNKVAHDLSFEITPREVEELKLSVPKWLRAIAEEKEFLETDDTLSLVDLLKAITLFFEMYRQNRAAHNALRAHYEKRRELAQRLAQHVLDTTGPNRQP